MSTQPEHIPTAIPTLSSTDESVETKLGYSNHVLPVAELDSYNECLDELHGIEDPLNWSKARKWSIISVVSAMTLVVNLATVMCTPAAPQILAEISPNASKVYINIVVSIWELGEAFGPLLVAPLSEMYGRYPIYHTANVLFIIFSIASALSTNIEMLVAFRFFNGIAVASVTLNASIVGDMFITEERGKAMAIMGIAPLLGPLSGPLIGGYMSQEIGWRWIFWFIAIFAGILELVFVLVFRETYKVKILKSKMTKRCKESGNQFPNSNVSTTVTKEDLLQQVLIRPARMLFLSPMIFLLATNVAMVFGYFYLFLTSITEVFQDIYHFSTGSAGLAFLGMGIGMTSGVFICGAVLDRYVKKKKAAGGMKPEHRLPVMVFCSPTLPIGLFLYGWSAQKHTHWIFPVLGTAILGFGVAVTIVPTSSYFVDAFGIHAASALAAMITMRCIVGAVLPLAGPALYGNVGLGWGNSILGFVALAFIPVPFILMRRGEKIRAKSNLRITF